MMTVHQDHLLKELSSRVKRSYALGISDYDNPRKVKRDFPKAQPKRKGSIQKLLERLKKLHPDHKWRFLSGAERKIISGAYELGLEVEHVNREEGIIK